MKIFKNFSIPKKYQRSSLAIGNFDGAHKGHQKVFMHARKYAKKYKLKFGILTFTPLPITFFNKNIKNYRLVLDHEKFKLFKKYKVDFIINIKFDKKFSRINADEFIKKIIYKKIYPKQIFVSGNFKFGNKRKGNVNLLKKFGKKYQYKLINISPYKYKKKIVSSSVIRKHLQKGNILLANKLLTRNWSIDGDVIKGKKIGRKLGYRTCNIKIKKYILPKPGIYAVKISIENDKKIYRGVAYLGSRPTFKGKEVLLEINIFRVKKNLYNKKLKVYFIKFIRIDKRFKNSSELIKQMNKDVISAKKELKGKIVV